MRYPDYINTLITRLEAHGKSAYIVGGSVRDMLLKKKPNDYDITTSSTPDETAKIFSDMKIISSGIKHGTLMVISEGKPVEITTYRIDGSYTDSRHPDSVRFTDKISDDLARRDFTVNAMAYNKHGGLVDIYGGKRDLELGLLRAVGDARTRFSEDALRIMRAFRFSAQLGFEIEAQTLDACREMAHGLSDIARERIGIEFIKLITSPSPAAPLREMRDGNILKYVLGDYSPSDDILSSIELMPQDDFARLGFLLADAERDDAKSILHGLRCSGKQSVGALAVMTGARHAVKDEHDARQLLAGTGIYARFAAFASELLGYSPRGAAELVIKQQSTPHSLRDLKINGKDIAALGARGKLIGQILDELLCRVMRSPELNRHDTLISLAKQIFEERNLP